MESKINAIDAGLIGGIIMLFIHSVWCLMVLFGIAQAVIDYILWIHFISPIYQVQKFDLSIAVFLLIIVTSIGFIGGYCIAKIINFLTAE